MKWFESFGGKDQDKTKDKPVEIEENCSMRISEWL